MLKELVTDLKEFIEMLDSDIQIIKQGKSNLTADQVVANIRNDLRDLIGHYDKPLIDLRR